MGATSRAKSTGGSAARLGTATKTTANKVQIRSMASTKAADGRRRRDQASLCRAARVRCISSPYEHPRPTYVTGPRHKYFRLRDAHVVGQKDPDRGLDLLPDKYG